MKFMVNSLMNCRNIPFEANVSLDKVGGCIYIGKLLR